MRVRERACVVSRHSQLIGVGMFGYRVAAVVDDAVHGHCSVDQPTAMSIRFIQLITADLHGVIDRGGSSHETF